MQDDTGKNIGMIREMKDITLCRHFWLDQESRLPMSVLYVIVAICFMVSGFIGASINTDSRDSRLLFTDAAGNGKLVLGSSVGDGSATFYKGTLEVSDAYLNRRIEDASGGDSTYLYLKNALVITGSGQSRISARYENESDGADAPDRYSLTSAADGLAFAYFYPGQEIRNLNIAGAVGTAWIHGSPIFHTPVIMNDPGGGVPDVIRWALTGPLNQPIQLPTMSITGTTEFILDHHLHLASGVTFLPSTGDYPATAPELKITFSNNRLMLGGTDLTWRSTLLFGSSGNIEMNADVNLSSAWLFAGNSVLQGNGNILDVSGRDADRTGTLGFDMKYLRDNPAVTVTLFLRDMKLRLRNGALFTHERTVLDLSNVEIELENTVNFTAGNVHISGPTMVYAKNHTFSISHGATMTVDGTILYFDSGDFSNADGVFPNDLLDDDKQTFGESLNFQNDGYIAQVSRSDSGGTVSISPSNINSGSGTSGTPYVFNATKNYFISSDAPLVFNASGETFYKFDGSDHFLYFTRESGCLVLQSNARVHFINTAFKDFTTAAVTLQGSGSSKAQIFFGEGCVLELGDDIELGNDGLYTLTFRPHDASGSVRVDGKGHTIGLPYASGQTTPGQIVVDEKSSSNYSIQLELENMRIDKLGGWPHHFEQEHNQSQLISYAHTNTILLRNARVYLSNAYTFSKASMLIDGIVHINGRYNLDPSSDGSSGAITPTLAKLLFEPMRESKLTISHASKLIFAEGLTLSIDVITTETTMAGMLVNGAPPFSGGTTGKVQYAKPWQPIVFSDDTATLEFDSCSMFVTGTGLFFQKGTVVLKNEVEWNVTSETHGGNAKQRIAFDTVEVVELIELSNAQLLMQGTLNSVDISTL